MFKYRIRDNPIRFIPQVSYVFLPWHKIPNAISGFCLNISTQLFKTVCRQGSGEFFATKDVFRKGKIFDKWKKSSAIAIVRNWRSIFEQPNQFIKHSQIIFCGKLLD